MRIQPVEKVIEYPAYKQNRERETMRNYELIKEIYEICQTADYRDEVGQRHFGESVNNLIEKHRPEIAGKLPTEESLSEEMRKYPHQDNHMD